MAKTSTKLINQYIFGELKFQEEDILQSIVIKQNRRITGMVACLPTGRHSTIKINIILL
jgi:hypothetical protein